MTPHDWPSLRRHISDRIVAEGLRPWAARLGLPTSHIRGIRDGRAPLITTVISVCEALGYDLVLRPRGDTRSVNESPHSQIGAPAPPPAGPPLDPSLVRVSHPSLARMVRTLVAEWDGLDQRGQGALELRFWGLHPDLEAAARRRERAMDRGFGR